MRKREREITDETMIRDILDRAQVIHLGLSDEGQNIESRDIGFKSHRGHCDHSIAASTADCGLAHGVGSP